MEQVIVFILGILSGMFLKNTISELQRERERYRNRQTWEK